MKINNQEVSVDDLVSKLSNDITFKKYGKNIYLSNNQVNILDKYQFNINNYSDISSLIFDIEEYLNDNTDLDLDDLESLSASLSEFNYYHNTNK